jgi:hypothetical protein
MSPLRILTAILGLGLAATIVWAFTAAAFWESFAVISADAWGKVTLYDLYLGFFLFALFIAWVERRAVPALLWILPIPFLGNIWTALWLVVRWRKVHSRLA